MDGKPFYSDPILEKKRILSQKLYNEGRLWSYAKDERAVLPDNELIVVSLTYLEIEEMDMLFDIFPYDKVKQVWIDEMVSCDDYYEILNKVLAYMVFGVTNYKEFKKGLCGRKD